MRKLSGVFYLVLFLAVVPRFKSSAHPTFQVIASIQSEETKVGIPGAKLEVFSKEILLSTHLTYTRGKIKTFDLKQGQVYQLVLSAEGFVSKVATIDARVARYRGGPWMYPDFCELEFQCKLFQATNPACYCFLQEESIIEFAFVEHAWFTFDKKQLAEMQNRIQAMKADPLCQNRSKELSTIKWVENSQPMSTETSEPGPATIDSLNRIKAPEKVSKRQQKKARKKELIF